MGYIINTIKAIFGKTESYELDEQKLSPEERETLKKMKELDKTEKIENSFIKSLQKEMKERILKKVLEIELKWILKKFMDHQKSIK